MRRKITIISVATLLVCLSFFVVNEASAKTVQVGTSTSDLLNVTGGIQAYGDIKSTNGKICFGADCKATWAEVVSGASNYWTLNGSNLYANNNSWNVGIGTTAPGAKLQVENSVNGASIPLRISNLSTGTSDSKSVGISFYGKDSATTEKELAQITAGESYAGGYNFLDSNLNFYTRKTNVLTQRMVITNDGSVGIGDTAPSDKLTIVGGLYATNGLKIGSSTAANWIYGRLGVGHGTAGTSKFAVNGNASIGDAYYNSAAPADGLIVEGNVGIGTTAPGYKLDVSGSFRATSKNHSLGASANWDEVGVDKQTALKLQGHDQFWIGAGNGTWYTGAPTNQHHDLLITTMNSPSPYVRGITFAAATNGSYNAGYRLGKWYSETSSATSHLNIDGGLNVAGSVGIGTTAPGQKLDVAGSIRTSSQLISTMANGTAPLVVTSQTKVTNLNADLLDGHDTSYFQTAITNPVTGTGSSGYLPKFTGTSAIGNSNVYTNGTNVGVGTTAPGQKLDVSGYAKATGFCIGASCITSWPSLTEADAIIGNEVTAASNGTLTRGGSGTAASPYTLALNLGNANTWTAAQTFNGGAYFPGSGIWNTSGNVGIGTKNPGTYKLNVAGNAYVNGSLFVNTNTDAAPLYITRGGGTSEALGVSVNDNTTTFKYNNDEVSNKIDFILANTDTEASTGVYANTSTAMTLYGDKAGNFVGIGGAGGLRISNSSQTSWIMATTTTIGLNSAAASKLGVWGNQSIGQGYISSAAPDNGLIVQGNVGIGTTGPGYKLDVAGSIRTSSQLISTMANGTAPLAVTSQTKVTNLNADLLDGHDTSYFQTAITNPVTGSGSSGYLPKFTSTSAIGNSNVYTNGTNVGIGTTDPGVYKLSVNNGATTQYPLNLVSSNKFLRMGALNSSWAHIATDADNGVYFYNSVELGAGNSHFNTSGGNSWIAANGGNVMIGNGTPGQKLDVAGYAKATGFCIGASCITAWPSLTEVDAVIGNEVTNTTNTTLTRSGSGTSGAPYTLALNLANANTWTAAQTMSANTNFPGSGIWNTSGNVGIGTSNPGSYKLNVGGNIYGSNNLILNGGLSDSASNRITNPGGGTYVTTSSSITGAWKIKLPTAKRDSSTMLRFTVKIYEYSTGKSRTVEVGGYNYSSGIWQNVFAYQTSEDGGNLNIRYGYDGTSDVVWIGDTNSTWSYPQVSVTDVQLGFNNYDSTWASGWSIAPVTSFDTVEVGPKVIARAWNQNNDGSGSGLDADLLDGHDTSYFQAAITNPVTGTGSSGYLPKFTGTSAIGNSNIYTNGTSVGIGTVAPASKLHVTGKTQITDGVAGADTQSYGTFGVTREASANPLSYIAMTRSGNTVKAMGIDSSNNWIFGAPTNNTQLISSPWLTITSAGSVGIGVVSPSQKLHVVGNSYFNGSVGIGTAAPGAKLNVTNTGANNAAIFINSTATQAVGNTAELVFGTGSGFAYTNGPRIYAYQEATSGSVTGLRFDTYNSGRANRMVITGAGKVGIGTTAPSEALEVNGKVKAVEYLYSSDRALKTNIATIKNPINKIMKLRGVTFDWKKDGSPSVGLIAQEVEKVFPELVAGQEGNKSVAYGNLVAPLIEAVKAQQKEIETLNVRINKLELELYKK